MRLGTVVCVALLAAFGVTATATAAEDPTIVPVNADEPANSNLSDTASLQRGAKYFVNYCMGCHSAKYVRYRTVAEGLHLSEDQLQKNLMFGTDQPLNTMTNAMTSADAEKWFGTAPPDLTLIARSRGVDYLYNYLRGFYYDPARPTGANNLVLHNSAMPDVLWELQGVRKPIYAKGSGPKSIDPVITGFKVVKEGKLSEQQFDQAVRDIVNFLDYVGEPMQQKRRSYGVGVILFLLIFFVLAYFLKKEIWKDVK